MISAVREYRLAALLHSLKMVSAHGLYSDITIGGRGIVINFIAFGLC